MDPHIAELENKYSGERIFLIGNGPSLQDTPLEKLNSEYTLAMNKINYIYDSTSWRPDFYYVSSPLSKVSNKKETMVAIKENAENSSTICLLNSTYSSYFSGENIYFTDRIKLNTGVNPFHQASLNEIEQMDISHLSKYWSDNLSHFAYHYHTMYEAVQFAVYAGFEEIYFVGTDLGMEYSNPHMIFSGGMDPNKYSGDKYEYIKTAYDRGKLMTSLVNGVAMKVLPKISGNNILLEKLQSYNSFHFDDSYIQDIKIHDYTEDETELRKGHVATKRICDNRDIDVFNATIGGELEIYSRKDIFDIL